MRIYLGNGDAVTIVDTPDDNSMLTILSDLRDLWGHHAADNSAASWVASDNDAVASVLVQEYSAELKSFADAEAAYNAASGATPADNTTKESAK